MPLPRGSKDGPEDLARRDAEGANFCSVRAHLSLTLVAFSVIDAEVITGNGQQIQDPSAGRCSSPQVNTHLSGSLQHMSFSIICRLQFTSKCP